MRQAEAIPVLDPVSRAALTGGVSREPIYEMVAGFLRGVGVRAARVLDIACGTGRLWPALDGLADQYEGADLVRYPELPAEVPFHEVDAASGRVPAPDAAYDAVLSLETIEHVENPRAFARELTRLVRPGGWVVVTTPNQLSFLSKVTLLFKDHFTYFGPEWYPSHLSALLPVDLRRIAAECGWVDVRVAYGNPERVVFTGRRWPRWAARRFPQTFSETVLIAGRKPGCGA